MRKLKITLPVQGHSIIIHFYSISQCTKSFIILISLIPKQPSEVDDAEHNGLPKAIDGASSQRGFEPSSSASIYY